MTQSHTWLSAASLPAAVTRAGPEETIGHPLTALPYLVDAPGELGPWLGLDRGKHVGEPEWLFSTGLRGWALSHWRPRPFDSAFIGRSIVEPSLLFSRPLPESRIVNGHLAGLLDRARGQSAWMVSTIPTQEAELADRSRTAGFEPLGTKHVYFCPIANRAEVEAVPTRLRTRRAEPVDCSRLSELSWRFEANKYLGLPGVQIDQVRALYREWIRRACSGEFADHALVAEEAGKPVGLFAVREMKTVHRLTGKTVTGHSLIAVNPGYPAAFPALVNGFQALALEKGWFGAEFTFYQQTTSVRRMLERYLCHAASTFTVLGAAPAGLAHA